MIVDGWYLMNTAQLEALLASFRSGEELVPKGAIALEVEDALAFRNAGNVPDDQGRSLRLVLRVEGPKDLRALEERRRSFEPDHLDPPKWRVAGSRPVNIVPLRREDVGGRSEPWWEQDDLAALEAEWQKAGRIDGVAVPGDYRGFVFKTILALRAGGRPITVDAITGSIERWVPPDVAAEIRAALTDANEP